MNSSFCCLPLSFMIAVVLQAVPCWADQHALLVGCTQYRGLKQNVDLKGPANDVVLMRRLLMETFGFPDRNVVTLAESSLVPNNKPTRAAIQREMARLAKVANKGDEVVIFLAGHGSQQPDDDPDNPEDREPDGFDEVFLPSDVSGWDGGKGTVANAIVDDELRQWLAAIRKKGAFVWVIVDACQSETMTRGDLEVARRVLPEDLIPAEVLQAARDRAVGDDEIPRGGNPEGGFELPADEGGLVAIYAAQSTEPTVERLLPPRGSGREYYGLLTYTLNHVLERAKSGLTYAELAQRINQQYVQWGRVSPTVLVEGPDRHRTVLGTEEFPDRSRFVLNRDRAGRLTINAGSLLGLTEGSVFAVRPAVGASDDDNKLLGYVRITQVESLQAVVAPIEFDGVAAVDDLPIGARCQLEYIDYGSQSLRVAIDSNCDGEIARGALPTDLEQILSDLAGARGSLVSVAASADEADLLLRWQGEQLQLVQVEGWSMGEETVRGAGSVPRQFGPVPIDDKDEMKDWLRQRLQRIARARSLLGLNTAGENEQLIRSAEVNVKVDVIKFANEADRQGEVIDLQAVGQVLEVGDDIGFRVTNNSQVGVDVTLLFIDSDFYVHGFFPESGQLNRVPPGKSALLLRGNITDATLGLEHWVVIAVAGGNQRIDFTCLADDVREATRSVELPRTPLGQLVQYAMYRQGNQRGFSKSQVGQHAVQIISCRVRAQ